MTTEPAARVHEVRLGRAQAPRSYRLAKLYRWRWDVTHYRPTRGTNPAVLDRRLHLAADCGYTVTKLGALRQVGKAVTDVRTEVTSDESGRGGVAPPSGDRP